jgi:hypothetical protein
MFRQATQTLQKDLLHMDSLPCFLADVTLHLPLQMDSANSDTFQQNKMAGLFARCDLLILILILIYLSTAIG